MKRISSPLYRLCKHAAKLLITAENNIIFHPGIIGITSLWDNYVTSHISNLYRRLNSLTSDGQTTRLRLLKGQYRENSPVQVLDMEISDFSKRNVLANIVLYEIILSKKLDIGTTYNCSMLDSNVQKNNDIQINKIIKKYVRETPNFSWQSKDQLLQSLKRVSDLGILYMSDCIINHTTIMKTWNQIQYENKYKIAKGPTPKWYKIITDFYAAQNYNQNTPSYKITKFSSKRIPVSRKRTKLEWV